MAKKAQVATPPEQTDEPGSYSRILRDLQRISLLARGWGMAAEKGFVQTAHIVYQKVVLFDTIWLQQIGFEVTDAGCLRLELGGYKSVTYRPAVQNPSDRWLFWDRDASSITFNRMKIETRADVLDAIRLFSGKDLLADLILPHNTLRFPRLRKDEQTDG